MIWLYLYLAMGLLTVLAISVHLLLKSKDSRKLEAAMRKDEPAKYSARWFLENVIYRVVGFVLIAIFWPLGWYIWIEERFKEWYRKRREETTKFRVRKKDLVAKMTVDEVEAVERVHDPLGAVPNVPFGHLNCAWVKFLEEQPEGAELWSFATTWEDYWGGLYERKGYVWVNAQANERWLIKEDSCLD